MIIRILSFICLIRKVLFSNTGKKLLIVFFYRNSEDGLYYDVTINSKKGNHKFVVDFVESGVRSVVSNRHVIVNSGAVPCPPLKVTFK